MATAIAAASPCCFAPSLLSRRPSPPPSSLRPPTCRASLQPSSRNLGLRVSAPRNRVAVTVAAANLSGTGLGADATPPSSPREVFFNLNHPRRKLLIQFKCNACGEFTDRAINREAYDRGTVFVQEVSFNLNHPRRKLLIQFKCNACGEFTDRAINREAYDRGTVFVQCAGCLVHHKLVDNLGLIVEYDLREDSGANTNDAEI